MVVIYLFRYITRIISRNLYWLTRLAAIKKGKEFKCGFPVIVEGKGKIVVGSNFSMDARVNIGCGKGSTINFGDNCKLEEGLFMRVGSQVKIDFGSHIKLEENTTIYARNNWQIGSHTVIASRCAIFAREPGPGGELIVGEGTNIGNNTIIDLSDIVKIGDNVAIGPNCTIYTHDHDYKLNKEIPWKGKVVRKPVVIEDGAWVGAGVTILSGVTIGKGAIVAAGAVVTKSFEAEAVIAGVPARHIQHEG